ncbi:hypothetical protein AB0J43_57920, partial [Nonomuraea fuscirosea]
MRVGHGSADLPVPDGTPMGGYLDRPGPSTGLLDPLSVEAVTWFDGERRFALATADVICVNEDLAHRVRSESQSSDRSLGCELWLAATHTHSGPETGCVPGGGPTPGPWLDRLSEAVGAYSWYLILIIAYAVALYPVLMTLRLRAEELSGRAENVQSTSLTRLRWAAGQLVVTALGAAALMAVAGLVFGTVYALLVGDLASDLPAFLVGALSTVPAAWCVGAVCVLAYGLLPRASAAISWLVWCLTAVLGQVAGPLYGVWGGLPVEPFHFVGNAMTGPPFAVVPTTGLRQAHQGVVDRAVAVGMQL